MFKSLSEDQTNTVKLNIQLIQIHNLLKPDVKSI